jgi:hypothetical protein
MDVGYMLLRWLRKSLFLWSIRPDHELVVQTTESASGLKTVLLTGRSLRGPHSWKAPLNSCSHMLEAIQSIWAPTYRLAKHLLSLIGG